MSAFARVASAFLVLAMFGSVAGTASASLPPPPSSSTPPSNVALYPLDEFVGRWNEANGTQPGPSSTAPGTTVVGSTTPVFPSIEAFAEAWNETAANMVLLDPSVEVFLLDPAAIVRGPLPPDTQLGDVEAFAVPIATNGFVGGLVDPVTGVVTSVTIGGDPDAQLVRSAAGVLLLSTLDVSVAGPAVEAWAALAADTSQVKLDYVVAGTLGVMLQVVEGAEAGDNLVSIVIAPATTKEQAFVDSYLTFIAVFGLALDAPPGPATTGPAVPLAATTTPIAPLPAVPPPAETTTTALPLISLAPPTPTTLVPPP